MRAAAHHGMCMPCFLSATQGERANALLDDGGEKAALKADEVRAATAALERIWAASS
jgi:hypothetical protein